MYQTRDTRYDMVGGSVDAHRENLHQNQTIRFMVHWFPLKLQPTHVITHVPVHGFDGYVIFGSASYKISFHELLDLGFFMNLGPIIYRHFIFLFAEILLIQMCVVIVWWVG